MSLSERRLVTPTVSMAELLADNRSDVAGESPVGIEEYADEIVRSGFPAIRALDESSRRDTLDGYLSEIVKHDFPDQGHVVRRPAVLRAWLQAYAAATAGTASYNA